MGKLLLIKGQGNRKPQADSCLECSNRTGLDTMYSMMHCQAFAKNASRVRDVYPEKCPGFSKKIELGLFVRIWRYLFAR